MIDITPIANAVIALAVTVLTGYFVPWIKGKIGAQKLQDVQAWVKILVAAAEQTYTAAQGSQKKQYVLERLEELGYTLDPDSLDDAIEAAVLELHHTLYVPGGAGNGG